MNKIVELKKIYYKLLDDIYEYQKWDELGCLPDECYKPMMKSILLKEKLGKLINEFDDKGI